MIMDRTYALENLKRLCYAFTNGTVAYDTPVLENGDVIDIRSTEKEIRDALDKAKETALREYGVNKTLAELIRPYGSYTENVHCMSHPTEEGALKHMRLIWKRLHAKYVTDSMPMTESVLAMRPAGMTAEDLSEDARMLTSQARQKEATDRDIIETILA